MPQFPFLSVTSFSCCLLFVPQGMDNPEMSNVFPGTSQGEETGLPYAYCRTEGWLAATFAFVSLLP